MNEHTQLFGVGGKLIILKKDCISRISFFFFFFAVKYFSSFI